MTASWDLVRLALREMVDRLVGEKITLSLVEIGPTIETIQDFTSDVKAFNLKVVGLTNLGGPAANIKEGLKKGHTLLNVQSTAYKKLAILLTDGGEALDVVTEMKNDVSTDFLL